jgi:hypothetical protein
MFDGITDAAMDSEMGLPVLLATVLINNAFLFFAILSTADSCLMAASETS